MLSGSMGRLSLASIIFLSNCAVAEPNDFAVSYQSVFVGYHTFAVSVPVSWSAARARPTRTAPSDSKPRPPAIDPHAAHRGHR